jgi:hypothetical protein
MIFVILSFGNFTVYSSSGTPAASASVPVILGEHN